MVPQGGRMAARVGVHGRILLRNGSVPMKDVFVVIRVQVQDDVSPEDARTTASDVGLTMVDHVREYARRVYSSEVRLEGVVV